jgi:predicted DCC family thiol-disulfide oxidoreductase YuxK
MEHPVLLYDGVCGFCNRLVQFVLRHDRERIFRFASLQSSFGSRVLTLHGVDSSGMRTAYVLESGDQGQELLQQSEAILFVMGRLGGIWSVLAQTVRLVPLRIRN